MTRRVMMSRWWNVASIVVLYWVYLVLSSADMCMCMSAVEIYTPSVIGIPLRNVTRHVSLNILPCPVHASDDDFNTKINSFRGELIRHSGCLQCYVLYFY